MIRQRVHRLITFFFSFSYHLWYWASRICALPNWSCSCIASLRSPSPFSTPDIRWSLDATSCCPCGISRCHRSVLRDTVCRCPCSFHREQESILWSQLNLERPFQVRRRKRHDQHGRFAWILQVLWYCPSRPHTPAANAEWTGSLHHSARWLHRKSPVRSRRMPNGSTIPAEIKVHDHCSSASVLAHPPEVPQNLPVVFDGCAMLRKDVDGSNGIIPSELSTFGCLSRSSRIRRRLSLLFNGSSQTRDQNVDYETFRINNSRKPIHFQCLSSVIFLLEFSYLSIGVRRKEIEATSSFQSSGLVKPLFIDQLILQIEMSRNQTIDTAIVHPKDVAADWECVSATTDLEWWSITRRGFASSERYDWTSMKPLNDVSWSILVLSGWNLIIHFIDWHLPGKWSCCITSTSRRWPRISFHTHISVILEMERKTIGHLLTLGLPGLKAIAWTAAWCALITNWEEKMQIG